MRPIRPARRRAALLLATAAASALMTSAALAQSEDVDGETEVEELVVTATGKPRGSVIGDIAPEITISPREIRAYGAADVSELLTALAPQLTSAQGSGGRPVVLIDGVRTSGFREVRDLPTEAISRVEILPEEVALKYGYPADQKVVNIVLRQRFRAWLGEAAYEAPTQGDGPTASEHLALLKILRGQRLTLDAKASQTGSIRESDRDIVGGDGDFRTLQPASGSYSLNGTFAKPFDNGISATFNGGFDSSYTDSRLGVSPFDSQALLRHSESQEGTVAAAVNGAVAGWQWSYTGALGLTTNRSDTDRDTVAAASTDRTNSTTTSLSSDVVFNRSLWSLPAGDVSTALTARASTMELRSNAFRAGVQQSSDLDRSILEAKANFDVPITRDAPVLGRLSGNLNLGYQQLSDYDGLTTVGGGLNWSPVSPLRLLASYTREDQAPTMNQLGDPTVYTTGVRVFDLQRGETVEVTRITGGSPDLEGGRREVFKLGVTYKPFENTNLNLQANYVSSRVRDGVAAFPSASTQVEEAFPERFVRNDAGELVSIDARPVNFARQDRDELRYGFTYSRPIGPQPTADEMAAFRQRVRQEGGPGRQGEARQGQGEGQGRQGRAGGPEGGPPPGEGGPPPGDAPPPQAGGPGGGYGGGFSRGGGGRGGFGGFGGGGARRGVFQVGIYHTVAFKDEVEIRPGVPVLDLLDGAAIGAGGGSPRHQVDLQANLSRGGYGAALNAKWQSGTKIVGGVDGDLDFSDMTTVNLRLFADLGMQPWARGNTYLRGTRVTLAVNNLFDERQDVRTADGIVPINYQPDLMDPVGRSVKLTVRKLFF